MATKTQSNQINKYFLKRAVLKFRVFFLLLMVVVEVLRGYCGEEMGWPGAILLENIH